MIAVKIMAGLGNQMFQYATARALAHRRHTNVVLDTSSYDSMASTDTPRKFELTVFPIVASVATPALLRTVQEPTSVKQSHINQARHRLYGNDVKLWSYHERTSGYNSRVKQLPDNSYLVGWWQCPKYFDDIRETLLNDFTPVTEPSAKNAAILKKVSSCNSVAIHVRRGDLVSNKHAAAHHGLAPIDYYTKSINYLQEKTDNPRFFVFSDDLEWCRKELPLPKNSVFVDGNDADMAFEDIRIMEHCKHAIIANSSFSWWGAWLNENPDKIVIAPKAWFQNTEANKEIEIVPDEWIRF